MAGKDSRYERSLLSCSLFEQRLDIVVGKRRISFKKGYYCYVGSALNNLEKRIARHKRKNKNKRWHIDYLTAYAKIIGVKTILTDNRIECKLSDKIAGIANGMVGRFGSSDCKCRTHLSFFEKIL